MKLKPLLSTLVIAIALTVTVGLVQQRQIFQKKAASASTTLTFIHQDHLGSISMVTDAAGHVVSRKTYNPYGSIKSSEGEFPTERGYTGQVSDSQETGLLYYNARYYDPVIAKFTQADKAADTLNKYAYVGNNPVMNTDPSGNMVEAGGGGGGGGGRKGRSKGSWGKPGPVDWTNPISASGVVGAQTIPMWSGGPGEEYPYAGNPDPEGFYKLLLSTAAFSVAVPVAVAGCAANLPLCGFVLQIADVTIDSAQCAEGDPVSCALIAAPIPGLGWVDDVAAAAGRWTLRDVTGTLVVHQANDPVLRQVIAEGVEYMGKDSDDYARLINASVYVDRVLPYSFNKLTSPNPFRLTKLGDFISCGTGVCKQRAALLHELLNEAGVPSKLIRFHASGNYSHLAVLDSAFKVWDSSSIYGRTLPGYLQSNMYTVQKVFNPIAH